MKNIHSLLLKSMPRAAKPKRSRIPIRILLIIFISAFIVVPAFIIITRALPKEGIGSIFYWIHDYIFLPIKGYTYTLFYPFSLSWWGPILTALFIWLVAYLAMVSFIKDPHVYVLRKVIRRNPKKRHGILIKTSGWLKKRKMEPILLKQVTNIERKNALNQLMNLPLTQMDENTINQVIHLTQLHINLMTLSPVKRVRETHLEALVYWHQAYLQADIRCQKNPPADQLKKMVVQLAKQVETLILPLLNYKDETLLKEAIEQRAGFDIPSVLVDMLYLASLNNTSLAVLLSGSPTTVNEEAVKKAVITRLAASVNERRVVLDETRLRLEKLLEQKTGPYNTSSSETFEPIIKNKIDIKLNTDPYYTRTILPVISELSLSIVLHLSALVDSVSIGLGYMDSLETYDFVFNCLEPEESGEPESPYFSALQSLNRLPGPGDYRLCAELAALEINEYEELWKQSILKEDGSISPGDFELAKSRIRSLLQAAGPGLDGLRMNTDKHGEKSPPPR
ncbi:MAG: hypothetical protein JSV88_31015 [Candidatus Aminicenantes bacterium]|nr:MAG: hypothetical protein JSV88_31015 [Candidatus Aminicenantes bacterium]